MHHTRFAISAAFLACGGSLSTFGCTHHIYGVSRCRGCRVERVPGFECVQGVCFAIVETKRLGTNPGF